MKKSDLATLQAQARVLESIQTNSLEHLTEILSSTFSALATSDPAIALDALEQLNSQKAAIEQLIVDRDRQLTHNVAMMVKVLPGAIVFQEEDADYDDDAGFDDQNDGDTNG